MYYGKNRRLTVFGFPCLALGYADDVLGCTLGAGVLGCTRGCTVGVLILSHAIMHHNLS